MQGKTVSGYTLQRLLGAGGMAEVWLAENGLKKKAAVKVLLPKFCDDESVTSRFMTEAQVMVELDHRNIRHVYDYGNIDGRPCIIMEYLEGEDLKARMKHGQRFTDAELVKWWNQLADALNYTHAKGIVHRDIKPGNIFVDNHGDIKLLDFGIAKVRASISSTQTGQKIGTLMYMSPEQVKDSKHIDHRTDLYSLAVTFVHLVTGKKPYDSDTSSDFEISNQIVFKPLDLSGLPEKWRLFLEPYLSKEAQDRPALKHFAVSSPERVEEAVPPVDDEATVCGNGSQVKENPPLPLPGRGREEQLEPPIPSSRRGGREADGVGPTSSTPKSTKKNSKTIVFVLAGVVVATLLAILLWPSGGDEEQQEEKAEAVVKKSSTVVLEGYTDLGLPSGTIWKNINEEKSSDTNITHFFTYDEAVEQFGSRLPSKVQWEELRDNCQWTWTGDGYKVTGPNGNSISLPAAGCRYCDGGLLNVGSDARYWSSSPRDSEGAWYLYFDSGRVDVSSLSRCLGFSVRLVQK